MANRSDIPWYEKLREEPENELLSSVSNTLYFLGIPLGYLALKQATEAIKRPYVQKIAEEIQRYSSKITPETSSGLHNTYRIFNRPTAYEWTRRQASVSKLISEIVRQHRVETEALKRAPDYAIPVDLKQIHKQNPSDYESLVKEIRKRGLTASGKKAADEISQRNIDEALYADATKNPLLVDILKTSRELDPDQARTDPNLNRFIRVIERNGKFRVTRIQRAKDRSFILHVYDAANPDKTTTIPVPSLDTNAANTNPFSARTAVTTNIEDLLRTDVPITRQVITHGGTPKVFPSRAYLTADGLPVEVNGTMQYLMDLERMSSNAKDVDDLNLRVRKYINANLIDPTVAADKRSMVVPVIMEQPDIEPGEGSIRKTTFTRGKGVRPETAYYKRIKNVNAPKIIRKEAAKHGVFMDIDKIFMDVLERDYDPTKAQSTAASNSVEIKRLPELTVETFQELGQYWREVHSRKQRRRRVKDRINTEIKLEPRRYGMSAISPASGIDSSDPYIILHNQITNPDKSVNYGAARNAEDYVINKLADDAVGSIEVHRSKYNSVVLKLRNGKRNITYFAFFENERQAKSFDSYLTKKIMKTVTEANGKHVSDLYTGIAATLSEVHQNLLKRKGVIHKSRINKVIERVNRFASDFAGTDMHIRAAPYRENIEQRSGNELRSTLRSLELQRQKILSFVKKKRNNQILRSIGVHALDYINEEEQEIRKELTRLRNRQVGFIIDTPDNFDKWGRYKGSRQSFVDRKADMIEEIILPHKLAKQSGIDLDGAIMLDSGDTKFNRQMELKNLTIRIITDDKGRKSVHMETSKSGAHTVHTITEQKEVQKIIKQMRALETIARRRAGRNYAVSSDTQDFMKVGQIKVGNRNYDLVTDVIVKDGNIRTGINEKTIYSGKAFQGVEYKVHIAYEEKSTAFKLSKGDANTAKSMHVIHNSETVKNSPILRYFDNGRSAIISARGKLREQPRTRGNLGIGAFIKLSEETFGGILDTAYQTTSIPKLIEKGISREVIHTLMEESMVNVAYSLNLGKPQIPKVQPLDKVKIEAKQKEHVRKWVRDNFNIRIVGNGSDRRVMIGIRDNVDLAKLHLEVDKALPSFEFTQGKMVKDDASGGYTIVPAKTLRYGLFDDYTAFMDKPILDKDEWIENKTKIRNGLLIKQRNLWSNIAKIITNETRTSQALKGILNPTQLRELKKFRFEIGNQITEAELKGQKKTVQKIVSSPRTYRSDIFTETADGPVFRVKNYHTTHPARAYTGNPNLGINIDLPNLFMMSINNPAFVGNLAHMLASGNDWMVQHILFADALLMQNAELGKTITDVIANNKAYFKGSATNFTLFDRHKHPKNPFLETRAYETSSEHIISEATAQNTDKFISLKDRIDAILRGDLKGPLDTIPTGLRVELEIDGEDSLRQKLLNIQERLAEMAKDPRSPIKKAENANIYNLNLKDLIEPGLHADRMGKLSIPLIIDPDEVIAAIRSVKGEENTGTMIASAVKGTNTAFSYQILSLLEAGSYINSLTKHQSKNKFHLLSNIANQILEEFISHTSRLNITTGSRESGIYHNFYKRQLYGSRFTATTNTANIAQSGTVLMTREYAQDFLIGDSRVATEARRFQAADKIRRTLTRHFKEIQGLLPENIRGEITNVDDLINKNTTEELIELMRDIMDRSTNATDRKTIRMRNAIENIRRMQGSTDYVDGLNWLVAHNRIWNKTNGYVATIGSIYRSVRTRMANIMRGSAEVVMLQRPPTHGPGDYIPLFMKIAKPNVKDIVERQGGIMLNASDIAMAFGDIDGDIMNAITKGYQTIWAQNTGKDALEARLRELRDTYMSRAYWISSKGGLRAANYMSEKAMRTIMEHNGESVVNFKRLSSVIEEQIKFIARETGNHVSRVKALADRIMGTLLDDNLYVIDTTPPEPGKKYKTIKAVDRNGNLFGTILTEKNLPAGTFSLKYETGRTAEQAAALKDVEMDIRESIKQTTNAFGLEEETYRAAMNRTTSAAIQKEAAGTPYRTVLKLNHMLGFLQNVARSDRNNFNKYQKFIANALKHTGHFKPGSPYDPNVYASDFANVVSDKILKPLAEQYALKAKHGILNIAEPVIEEIEKLSRSYYQFSREERINKTDRGDRETIESRINRLLNVEDLYIRVEADQVDAVFSKDRIRIGDYRDYMKRKFENVDTLINEIGGEELKTFNAQHDISSNPEGRLKVLIEKLDKLNDKEITRILDKITGENVAGYRDFKTILTNKNMSSRDKVVQLLAVKQIAGEVVAGVARMKHSLELNKELLHGMLSVMSTLYKNTTMRGAVSQFSETFDAIQDLVSRGKTSNMVDFLERLRTRGSRQAFEYLTGLDLGEQPIVPNRISTLYGEIPRSGRLKEFNPLADVAESSKMRLSGLFKGAIIGTLVSVGIENVLNGSPVPEVESAPGKGGEYWEKKPAKQSEMMIKPRPPLVEKLNPTQADATREMQQLARQNSRLTGMPYEEEEQRYKQVSRGMIIR